MTTELQKLDREFEKLRNSVNRPNILLAGGTGVGKSSLINHIFGRDLAASGTGKPITNSLNKYEDETSKVVIYDSKGYEIGSEQEKEFMDDVIGLCQKDSQASEKIHIVWYLIQASGSRITDFDIESIKRIQNTQTPVAIVFTKSDLVSIEDAKKLMSVIKDNFAALPYFEVSTKQELPAPALTELEQQLKSLVTWTHEQLPDALKLAFIAEQRTNLEDKRQRARKIVLQHSTVAFATGFIPIPASDAPALLANQYALLARVLYLFGLDSDKDKYSIIIKTAITSILPTLGKWGVAQCIKAFPGIGSVIGGTIAGGVAASLTAALGYAIVETVHYSRAQNLEAFSEGTDALNETIMQVFQDALNKELDNKGINK